MSSSLLSFSRTLMNFRGDPNDTMDIRRNDLTVLITVNLVNALGQFRNSRRLWADALCVHQKEMIEAVVN